MSSREASRSTFYPHLEAVRGIAALMVALFHIGQLPCADEFGRPRTLMDITVPWLARIFKIFGNGPGAVIIFFVLSGFVLTMVLEKGDKSEARNAWEFLAGRMFRLYPAVIAALGVYALLLAGPFGYSTTEWGSAITISHLILNGLLIQPAIIGVTWSLQLEVIAAPMLLLVFMCWHRIGYKAWLVPYLLLVVLSFTSVWNHLIGPPNEFGQIYAFLAGMAAYLHGKALVQRLKNPRSVLISCVVGFALTRALVGWSSYWTILLESAFGASIIAILAFGITQQANDPFYTATRFYGRISYSFYLLHPLSLVLLTPFSDSLTALVSRGFHPLLLIIPLFVFSVLAITPLAWLQYLAIERVFVGLGRRLTKRIKQPASTDEMTILVGEQSTGVVEEAP